MLTNNPYVQKLRFEEQRTAEGRMKRILVIETMLKHPGKDSAAVNDNAAYASLAEDLKHLQYMADNGFGDFDSIEVRTIN